MFIFLQRNNGMSASQNNPTGLKKIISPIIVPFQMSLSGCFNVNHKSSIDRAHMLVSVPGGWRNSELTGVSIAKVMARIPMAGCGDKC